MFTAYWTLNRRSPLARIWMAAHMEKKLTKAIVAEVNVNAAVEELRNTDERGGLRTTGYLLLGIVRIYAKKTGFLLTDAHDIVAMLKMAFAPSLEKIVLDEDSQIRRDPTPQPAEFPWELEYEEEESSGIRLADRRDITMQEEDFFAFDDRLQADVDMAQTVEALSRLATPSFAEPDQNFTSPVGAFDYIEQPTDIRQELARRRTLTQSPGMERRLQESATPIPEERVEFGETPICTPAALQGATPQQPSGILEDSHVRETPQAVAGRIGEDEIAAEGRDGIEAMEVDEAPQAVPNISAFEPPLDVPESFVLEPLNISDVPVRHRAARRRRRLVVDTEATLSDQLVRDQIMDHGDIIRPALDLAPPTRRLMRLKDTATMDALMTNPASHLLIDSRIRQIYAEQLQPGVRPDDSDESLLSSHLRAEMDMAQVVEAPSRLPTPSFAEPDQNFTSPVGAFDYIEQPETITPELTRRRTPTPGPGPEHLPESATPIPEERVEFGETPICTPAEAQGPTPQQPSGIFQDSHVMETPQAGVGRFGEDESPAEGHDRDVTEISSAERKDLLGRIALGLAHQDQVSFSQYIRDEDSKRTVARKFFGLLEARKNREIKVHQLAPYAEIYIEADENLVRSS